MEKNTIKKSGVYIISALIIGYFVLICALYFIIGVPIVICAVLTVIYAIISIVMIFVAKERIDEINRGQDDDCNHY